jgi:hypothetical protein
VDRVESRHVCRLHPEQDLDTCPSDGQRCNRSDGDHQSRLSDRMSGQASTRSAERHMNRHIALTCHLTSELQVHQVRAGEHEHLRNGSCEDEECWANCVRQPVG